MFPAHVAEVVITAPDNTSRYRTAINQALNWWNSASARSHQIVLLPLREQHDSSHEGLDHVDEPATRLDRGDVFIAIVDPSRRGVDEAIRHVLSAKRAGKLAAAWFIAEAPSGGPTSDNQGWLSDVTRRLTEAGIVPRYVGRGDFLFDSRLQSAMSADLTGDSLRALKGRVDGASPSPRVAIHQTPVTLLGPQIWAVTVINDGHSLVTGLTVSVDAIDSEGHDVPGGVHRSNQPLAEVFAKLRTGLRPDDGSPPVNGPDAASLPRKPGFLTERMDILAAHTTLNFPRWLRPTQHASALYDVESGARLRVRIQCADAAGTVWGRTNDAEPHVVSTASHRRHRSGEPAIS
ncbi:MAG: hypothetical protein QOJ80_7541 [Mycobacterium sp.]|nr:hypothetical protein [Mycobacterium sp.]